MRVFYPMSARIADLANEPADLPSGVTMLWSIFCFAMLALVCAQLPSFETKAVALNSQYNQSVTKNDLCAMPVTAAREYVKAHRCAV